MSVGDGSSLDEVEDVGKFGGGDGGVLDFEGLFVKKAEEVVDDPVGDFFAGGLCAFDGGFEVRDQLNV